jgi:hypothetical protein
MSTCQFPEGRDIGKKSMLRKEEIDKELSEIGLHFVTMSGFLFLLPTMQGLNEIPEKQDSLKTCGSLIVMTDLLDTIARVEEHTGLYKKSIQEAEIFAKRFIQVGLKFEPYGEEDNDIVAALVLEEGMQETMSWINEHAPTGCK